MKRCRDTFLHLDNITPHRAPQDFDRLGIAGLPHLPDSPDPVLCDFWLFGNLKTKLAGNTFTSAMERMAKVNEILMDIPWHEFISVLDEWKRRLIECIDTRGDYL
jgi:hypothetical protein